MLYDRGYSRQDILNLYRFIDWVMVLPEGLDRAFWQELRQFEEEQHMSYVTTGERIGFERGRQEGRQEGRASLVLRLLERRIGKVPESVRSQIQSLSADQLESLGEALLDFSSLEEAIAWLSAHPNYSIDNS